MPIALDPAARIRVTLKSEAKRPEAERAAFTFRPLTGRDVRLYGIARKQAVADEDAAPSLIYRMLAVSMIDWANMTDNCGKPIPFPVGPDTCGISPEIQDANEKRRDTLAAWLEVLLTHEEAGELLEAVSLTNDDRKKSESQSPTGSGVSAPAADPQAAV